ncbi:MAG: PLP-dependent aminotransferase family protein, partial [Clostridia bacterium]|nr:PLP-dependent aminotransferase family protein [Clostridia bacterium]
LMAEGYIYSVPKSGFYVSHIASSKTIKESETEVKSQTATEKKEEYFADFVKNNTTSNSFPFVTWTKLMRETMSDEQKKLMVSSPSVGIYELRKAIADYLFEFRGMKVDADRIVIGAGTEYLYSLIIQLLGRNKRYALEDPGYRKIYHIYKANEVDCVHVPLDSYGIDINMLEKSNADVLHISPSHHFPTGIVTPISRRYELLSWAAKFPERYIIEDDYDSEFRLMGKPIPSLQSVDILEKVIYINTFSKSLTPTIRISYMVLPEKLMKKYNEKLSFYSCTVANFEQYTLASFIRKGYFEKHINRMRNYYRSQRDSLMEIIRSHPMYDKVTVTEEDSGLHFLMTVKTDLSDSELMTKAKQNGINISCLEQYYSDKSKARKHTLIINYSGIEKEKMTEAVDRLFNAVL